MSAGNIVFRRGVVKPLECLQTGWQLIKSDYWLFLGICVVGGLIGGVVPLILTGPMMCGIYLCLLRRQRGKTVDFGMLFEGFNYFVESLIATLLMAVPGLIVAFVLLVLFCSGVVFTGAATHDGDGGAAKHAASGAFWAMYAVFILIMILLSMILQILFLFTFPLIADRKLRGWEAVQVSIKTGLANFGGVLGLVLLNALISLVGLMLCYVGAFFVMPITFAALAMAYRQVFPAEEMGEVLPATN
jgi:hypothetical protein